MAKQNNKEKETINTQQTICAKTELESKKRVKLFDVIITKDVIT